MFAIWLPMLAGDSASSIDHRVLDDPRVVTFWDPRRIVGNWFANHAIGGLGGAGYTVWDAFFGFARAARWTTTPTRVVATGSEIIGHTGALEHAFIPLLR